MPAFYPQGWFFQPCQTPDCPRFYASPTPIKHSFLCQECSDKAMLMDIAKMEMESLIGVALDEPLAGRLKERLIKGRANEPQ